MSIQIIAILLGAFMLLEPGVAFGQKAKGAKSAPPDFEQMEKEIEAVTRIYQPIVDKYLNELKKMKDYDEMAAEWENVIEEDSPSKKSSMNKIFHDKYRDRIAAAIAKCGINGPVFRSLLKKNLKIVDFDIDRNTGTLLMYKKWGTAEHHIPVGNCNVEHEWELSNGFDNEIVLNDGSFFADGNTGAEDKKIFAAAEYGDYQMERSGTIQVPDLDDVCNYRLYASGSYDTKMVYYANICPVLVNLDTRIVILDENNQVLYTLGEVRAPVILPFQTSDEFLGSIEPVYNGNFIIDMNVNALQFLTHRFIVGASTERFICFPGADILGGYVHAYSEIKFDKKLKILYYTYSY